MEKAQGDVGVYERRILRELEEIEYKLKELNEDREALKRQLIKARSENNSLKDVSRKNSANRIIIEEYIVEYLKNNNKPTPSKKLYDLSKSKISDLKYNSFRTILHRMKEKGIIKNKSWGLWISH